MAEVVLRLKPRHEGQARVAGGLARFSVLACGRRWGKTAFMIDLAVNGEPSAGVRGLVDGVPVGWFAPNLKYADEVWLEIGEVLKPLVARRDVQQRRLELRNGGVFQIWTLHNTKDAGRGRKYGLVLVDEAAMVPDLGFIWSRSIRPTLTDLSGSAVFSSTPAGNNFFRELFDRDNSSEGGLAGWRSWQLPTVDNPFIPADEVVAARGELDELSFRTEYLAEFIDEFGAQFGDGVFYDASELPVGGVEGTGCDFAYSSGSGDWTVFLTGRAVNGVLFLTSMFRERGSISEWAPELVGLPSPFGFVGGQERLVLDALNRDYGVFVRTQHTFQKKLPRAQPVIAAWNRGEVRLPRGLPWVDDVVRECRAFTGIPGMDAHDDIVDALAGLHYSLIQSRFSLAPRSSVLVTYAS